MAKKDLGTLLRDGRHNKGFSQAEVASKLKLKSPQSVSDWERNYGSGVPVPMLKTLIRLYKLDQEEVFQALVDYKKRRVEMSLKREFYSGSRRKISIR